MSAELLLKHFTSGADVEFVQGKYRKTLEMVIQHTEFLAFTGMVWISKEEWDTFFDEVIPECMCLKNLYLQLNPNLKMDIVNLVAKLPPTIEELYLEHTGCFGDSARADWTRLPALKVVVLSHTQITGSKEDLASSGCEAGEICMGTTDFEWPRLVHNDLNDGLIRTHFAN